ncbi:MAG: thioredoxin family protein [Bacteroidales bacterium]|nr:thioredoxin family protein [Bacteroidales bacterium]
MKKSVILLIALLSQFFAVIGQELPVTWQFKAVAISDEETELRFTATIKEGWHLFSQYHHSIELPTVFTFKESEAYSRIGKVTEPKCIVSYDPVFQDTSKYFEKFVTFKQKIKVKSAEAFQVKGNISGQACIDGRCVAMEKKFTIDVAGNPSITPTAAPENAEETTDTAAAPATKPVYTPPNADIGVPQSQEDTEDSLLTFFLLAFLGGLVGLLTPCVFPMIPMTISFFMKSGKNGKFQAIFYGLSIIFIYVLFGVILSLIFGASFSNILSTHWLPNILFAVIFILFAISLLGYFEITLPSKWTTGSAKMEGRGGLVGVFFMALTLVLVSFSCTLPIAGAVALNAAGGSLLKPIIGMFGFSLAFALPFTFFAFFPGLLKSLPKSGGWMNTLKVTLAFIELAFALKFLNVPDQAYHWGLLDREIYLAFWIVILALLGFYLLGKIRFPLDDEMPYQRSWFRFLLAICTFTFVVYLVPGMFGAPLKAISGWLPPTTTQDFDINEIVRKESKIAQYEFTEEPKYGNSLELPHGIKGYFDYEQALRVAKKENKPIFLDFTGHGCVNCRNVESAVWVDPRVRNLFAKDFVVLAMYVDDKTIELSPEDRILDADGDTITTLGNKNMYIQNTVYKEVSQPCYFVISPDGKILAGPLYYELDVDKYLEFLNEGLKKMQE